MADKRPRRSLPWADPLHPSKRARAWTSPKDELEDLIAENDYIRIYVTYQWNFNRAFQHFHPPAVIIDELSRSSAWDVPRRHTIHKRIMETLAPIRSAVADHNHWTEVWGSNESPMPRIPTSARLQALRYLDLDQGVELDASLSARFNEAQLRWHLDGTPPPAFWKGARLDDPDFREKHMAGMEPSKEPSVDGERLVDLIRDVFPTRPDGVEIIRSSNSAQGQEPQPRPVPNPPPSAKAPAPASTSRNPTKPTVTNEPTDGHDQRGVGAVGGSAGGASNSHNNSTSRSGARPGIAVAVPKKTVGVPQPARQATAAAAEHEATIRQLRLQLADKTARLTRAEAELQELEEDFEDLAGEAGEERSAGDLLWRRRLDRLETKHKERDSELVSLRHLLATVQEQQVEERLRREQLERDLASLRQQQPHAQGLEQMRRDLDALQQQVNPSSSTASTANLLGQVFGRLLANECRQCTSHAGGGGGDDAQAGGA